MKRRIVIGLALLGLWGASANFALAQFGTLGQAPVRVRPTVSPLINQNIGGGINAFSYYGIIKPQMDANRQIRELQQRVNLDGSLRSPLTQDTPSALGGMQTGHPASFFYYGGYFPMSPPMGGGASIGGGNAVGFGTGMGTGINTGIGSSNRGFYGPGMGVVMPR